MSKLEPGRSLPVYVVTAFNFATESENKIHDDAVARDLGFAGGLVPGVGDYAYLTRPVLDALGDDWLERGALEARFVQPVYDGDRVEAAARVRSSDPPVLDLELRGSAGTICATGEASLPASAPQIDAALYPVAPLPAPERRPPAALEVLEPGTVLGALHLDAEDVRRLREGASERFRDDHPLFADPTGPLHPAFLPDLANQILSRNVRLGPWIHTASATLHAGLRGPLDSLSVRGRVVEAGDRRGHHTVVLDVALFGPDDRPLGKVLHTAIIRPRQLAAG